MKAEWCYWYWTDTNNKRNTWKLYIHIDMSCVCITNVSYMCYVCVISCRFHLVCSSFSIAWYEICYRKNLLECEAPKRVFLNFEHHYPRELFDGLRKTLIPQLMDVLFEVYCNMFQLLYFYIGFFILWINLNDSFVAGVHFLRQHANHR